MYVCIHKSQMNFMVRLGPQETYPDMDLHNPSYTPLALGI